MPGIARIGRGPLVLNRSHTLNKGLVSDLTALPHTVGGRFLVDNLSSGTFSLRGTARVIGGFGPVGALATPGDATSHLFLGPLSPIFNGVNKILTVSMLYWTNAANASGNGNIPFGSFHKATNPNIRTIVGGSAASGVIQMLFNTGAFATNFAAVSAGSLTLNDKQWYHIIITLDIGSLSRSAIYLNGHVVTSTTPTGGTPPTVFSAINADNALTLGTFFADAATTEPSYFNGRISHFRIYNRGLSAAEAWELYQQNMAGFGSLYIPSRSEIDAISVTSGGSPILRGGVLNSRTITGAA